MLDRSTKFGPLGRSRAPSFGKPRAIPIAIALTLATAFTNCASAERSFYPTPYDVIGVSKNDPDGLVMRSGPGPSHKKVGSIPYNANTVYLGDCEFVGKGQWCYVKYGSTKGWVNYRYLRLDYSQPSAPAQEADVHNGDPVAAEPQQEAQNTAPDASVRLRAEQHICQVIGIVGTYQDEQYPISYEASAEVSPQGRLIVTQKTFVRGDRRTTTVMSAKLEKLFRVEGTDQSLFLVCGGDKCAKSVAFPPGTDEEVLQGITVEANPQKSARAAAIIREALQVWRGKIN